KMKKILILLLLLTLNLYAEEETKFIYNGNYRVRGFAGSRDLLLKKASKGTTPEKEALGYVDTRLAANLGYGITKRLQVHYGFQIGDMRFGGNSNLKQKVQTNNPFNPTLIGFDAGGDIGQKPINLQSTFLYVNYRGETYNIRVGLQQFSSPNYRVLFANGTGVFINKDFVSVKQSLQGGYIRGNENSIYDKDNNNYNDNLRPVGMNIGFIKWKYYGLKSNKLEIYVYGYDNNVKNTETGHLYWTGIFYEYSRGIFSFSIQPVYQTGVIYTNDKRYAVKGGFIDTDFKYNSPIGTFSTFFIGSSGRAGTYKDGTTPNYLKGGGYKSLLPLVGVSNIALDYTGGYSLFSPVQFSGIYSYGLGYSVRKGMLTINPAVSAIYSNKTPYIENNKNYTSDKFYSGSNYIGNEFNLNFIYNLGDYSSKFILRTGIFAARDGYYTLMDTEKGKYIREVLLAYQITF
ncbi:MAG: hypothetical protein KDK36_11980, partial [Leptospiraceae bacterium]|nr:hypothetical protein [Leptospiraceae bacterium]